MEFIERVDIRATYWLLAQPKPMLMEILKRRKGMESIEIKYNRLYNFLKDHIKGNGQISRTYTYSFSTVPEWGGRLHSGSSVQGQPREIRGLLMRDTTDIDMKNAHPVILQYLCKTYNIMCPNLDGYVANRDKILESFPNRDKAKELFLTAMNDNKLRKSEHVNKIFKRFDEELKDIQNIFYNMEIYGNIRDSVPLDRADNKQGSMLNRILCSWENRILQVAIDVSQHRGLDIAVPMFDGFMIYGNHYGNEDLLDSINQACNSAFTGLNIQWVFKGHCMELNVPTEFTIPEDIQSKKELLESEKKKANEADIESRIIEFEKTHCKIINADLYVIEQPHIIDKPILFKTKEKLQNAYSHMKHIKPDSSKNNTIPFITYWVNDNPNIRSYRDMDTFPNSDLCPSDMYNLWKPFACECLPEAPENHNGVVDFFKDHILTLSGLCTETAKYFECWIAQMIQYPEIKSNCPVLISNQGAGKGQTLSMLKAMLGEPKVYECTNPARDVLGAFNGRMSSSFLVNINEAKRKDTTDGMGQFYALITDKKITINEKGISQYEITSHHRFIITTNNTDPINIADSNRRFWITRCSDRRIGDVDYFMQMGEYTRDPVSMKSLYGYLKSHQGYGPGFSIENFNSNPMPVSEFQRNIQMANLPIPIKWLIHFTETHSDMDTTTMLSSSVYSEYKMWLESNGIDYKINAIKFGLALVNDTNGLVSKGPHTRKGNTQILNLSLIRQRYNITTKLADVDLYYGNDEEDHTDFKGIA